MKKDLTKNSRGISHYLNLKSAYENGSEQIIKTLTIFYRIMFLDKNPWITEINRFDFLKLAVVSSEFNEYQKILVGNFNYKKILPNNINTNLEISIETFFDSKILKSDKFEYTIKEFILSLAYTGDLHMSPDKNEEKINYINETLFIKYPEFTYDVTDSISKVLIDIFDEFYSLLNGNSNGISSSNKFQPFVSTDEKTFGEIVYNHSLTQFPIRKKKNKGIRFCLELRLLENNKNKNQILSYGHRNNPELSVDIYQSKTYLIIQIKKSKQITIKLDVKDLFNKLFFLEVCIYPNGQIVTAINEHLKTTDKLNEPINIIDGKVIIGANLNGDKFGNFHNGMVLFQSIDKLNNTRNLGMYSRPFNLNIQHQNIPFNLIKRKI